MRKTAVGLTICLLLMILAAPVNAQIHIQTEYLSFDNQTGTIYTTIGADKSDELQNGDTISLKVYASDGEQDTLIASPAITLGDAVYSEKNKLYYFNYSDAELFETAFDPGESRADSVQYKVEASAFNRVDQKEDTANAQFLNPPVLDNNTFTFDLNPKKIGNISFSVTIPGGGSVTSIENYFTGNTLTAGTEYSVSGNTFTLKAYYLKTLGLGTSALVIKTSGGLYATVNIDVVNTTPSLDISKAEFDHNQPMDIVGTFALNGNTLSSIQNESSQLISGTDYIAADNAFVIRKSYLNYLWSGTHLLLFKFSDGTDGQLDLTVTNNPHTSSSGTHTQSSSPVSPTPNPTPPADTGKPTVVTDGSLVKVVPAAPKLDATSHSASVTVDADTMNSAFASQTADKNGVKQIQLEIPAVENATAYVPELPASAVASGDGSRQVNIQTAVGSIVVPGNMLAASEAAGGQSVSLRIASADTSKLDEKVRAHIGNHPVIELNLIVNNANVVWNNPDAPITVSIPYTPTAEELQVPDNITVWYIDDSGNAAAIPTGKYDPDTKAVVFTTTHFSKYAVAFVNRTFSDINTSYAKKQIESNAAKGITSGTTETTYSPAANITRGDFVVMLVRALGLNAKFDTNFADAKEGGYQYNALGAARKLGIIQGLGGNCFAPDTEITREDMMTIVAKALNAAKKITSVAPVTTLNQFTDALSVSDYAKPAVSTLVKEGIVHGYDQKIQPKGRATREEMAVLLYNICKM